MAFHTRNPILSKIDSRDTHYSHSYVTGQSATFTGIATKSSILLGIVLLVASYIWINFASLAGILPALLLGSIVVAFVSVLIASISKTASPVFSIIYAVAEGVLLGSLSYVVQYAVGEGNINASNIVINAVTITFAIFIFLLIAYSTGIFKVGNRFRNIVYTATIGIFFFYLISFILSRFGVNFATGLSPQFMILFTLGMILLASFNLLIDFDNCKIAVNSQLPKRYEWQLSLGLIVTLVWLYIEVLRLLLILANRRD